MCNLGSIPSILILAAAISLSSTAHAVSIIDLGRELFENPDLSRNRNVACETCHSAANAFSDPRKIAAQGSVSQGTSAGSFGRRNTPTLTYTPLIPPIDTNQTTPTGGLFFDGRSNTFEDQLLHPLFAENEMGLPNKEILLSRVKENPRLEKMFRAVFGETVLNDSDKLLLAVGKAVAAFERSPEFFSFDSKYDRFLSGEYSMTPIERKGYRLFFSDVTNCMNCHLLHKGRLSKREPFTDHQYHNIGVPRNKLLLKKKYLGLSHIDLGLAENPRLSSRENQGKFRTPTLRNAAITPPYMHNGVFKKLETTILFYNRYLLSNDSALINPETRLIWRTPEVSENIDNLLLRKGQPLSRDRVEPLVAFLKLLTDKRYESLID